MKPDKRTVVCDGSNWSSPEIKSLTILPNINGITIRKENRAAFDLSLPSNTEVEIVAPDLDTPGNMAKA